MTSLGGKPTTNLGTPALGTTEFQVHKSPHGSADGSAQQWKRTDSRRVTGPPKQKGVALALEGAKKPHRQKTSDATYIAIA